MSENMKNVLKSWGGTFVAAVISAFLAIVTATQELPTSSEAWLGVLIAGLVAVLPVIRNWLDTNYAGYGRVSDDV
jgi:hypothetical protein